MDAAAYGAALSVVTFNNGQWLIRCSKTNGNGHTFGWNGEHISKFHTKCMKISVSFPSYLPDTHTVWDKITRPVSIGGSTPSPTVGVNFTAATANSSLTVDVGTANLIQKTQVTFSGISKTVTDPDISGCYDEFSKTRGDLK